MTVYVERVVCFVPFRETSRFFVDQEWRSYSIRRWHCELRVPGSRLAHLRAMVVPAKLRPVPLAKIVLCVM